MQNTPKQCRLLGATVKGVGVIVAVSTTLQFGYAVLESADRVNRRVALADLERDEVVFPLEVPPYRTQTERVAYGTWTRFLASPRPRQTGR